MSGSLLNQLQRQCEDIARRVFLNVPFGQQVATRLRQLKKLYMRASREPVIPLNLAKVDLPAY